VKAEKQLVSAFLRGELPRGHINEEFVLIREDIPVEAQRVCHFRADIVIWEENGCILLYEAKLEANASQLGQLLVYRELLQKMYPGEPVRMFALCGSCSEVMRKIFDSYLVNVVVLEVM